MLADPGRAAVAPGGNLFVADTGNDRVQVFAPTGDSATYLAQFGSAALEQPFGIAIDRASGDIYVADADGVTRFNEDFSVDAGFADPGVSGALAVDPISGELLVADRAANTVTRFGADGGAAGSFDGSDGATAFTGLLDIAVNSAGDVYVVDATGDIANQAGTSQVLRYSGAGTYKATLAPVGPNQRPARVAVDPATDEVLVSGEQDAVYRDLSPTLYSFDAADALLSEPEITAQWNTVSGLAFAESGARFYVILDRGIYNGTPHGSPGGRVFVVSAPPTVSLEPVDPGSVTSTEAELSGSVDPNGFATEWALEYRFAGDASWQRIPRRSAGAGESPTAVTVPLRYLQSGTEYEARLWAENGDGEATTAPVTFATPDGPPIVSTTFASEVNPTSAWVVGGVNPAGLPTTYWLEYGTASCAAGSCARVPAGPGTSAGSGLQTKAVARKLTGLSPDTTYHFRVVAENPVGVAAGADRTFRTRGNGDLSFGIELVSPPEKNGGAVSWDPAFSAGGGLLSPDGQRVAYTSRASFAEPKGAPISSVYLAERGPSAWLNQALTPRVITGEEVFPPTQASVRFLSRDLTKAVVQSNADPVTGERTAREDLYFRQPGGTGYRRLSPDPAPGGNDYAIENVATEVPDWTPSLGHIVFVSAGDLTPEAVGLAGSKAYVIDTTTAEVTLASVLGDSPGTPVAVGGTLLSQFHHNENALSDDGTKLFFEAEGELHQRDLASGETLDLPGTFQDATPDGRYVFVRTAEQLAAEDQNAGVDLYRFDTAAPAAEPVLVSADSEPADGVGGGAGATLAVTADGGRAYFTMAGQQLIADGPTDPGRKLYLWDEGALHLVANYQLIDNQPEPFEQGGPTRLSALDINPSGDSLVVSSAASLAPPQGSAMAPGGYFPEPQIYAYDLSASTPLKADLRCLSCLPGPGLTSYAARLNHDRGFGMFRPSDNDFVTEDGRVFFQSQAPLVPTDVNGSNMDVYSYKDGELDLLSGGREATDTYLFGASASGTAAFATDERLSRWDIDGAYDAYVARPGGGLPDPPIPPPPCEGEACRGPAQGLPPAASPASAAVAGPGNVRHRRGKSRARKCKAGQKARTVRNGPKGKATSKCVKKKSKKRNGRGK